jgi:hypothetical protein
MITFDILYDVIMKNNNTESYECFFLEWAELHPAQYQFSPLPLPPPSLLRLTLYSVNKLFLLESLYGLIPNLDAALFVMKG